ncbi:MULTISPECIES: hypothetical protein [Streptomyces]|uniref:hypothetical protein n=1 Tax=Streptomyces TaxID=1883 RepID=UPI0009A4F7F2|nr:MULTISPECIES: hypothetical protein [Streptomyces]
MTDQQHPEPVLSQITPLADGLGADEAYELAMGDIQLTVASISAVLADADEATTARLRAQRSRLNRLQLELRPEDANAVAQARDLCRQVREELPGGGR